MDSNFSSRCSVFSLEGLRFQSLEEMNSNSVSNDFHNPVISEIEEDLKGINTLCYKLSELDKGIATLAKAINATFGEKRNNRTKKGVSELRKQLSDLWEKYYITCDSEIILKIRKVVSDHFQSLRNQLYNVKKWANVLYQLIITELFSDKSIFTPDRPILNLKIVSKESIDEDGTGSVYYLEKHLSVKHSYSIISNGSANQRLSPRENQRGYY